MSMLSSLLNSLGWLGGRPVGVGGSFRPNGASGIVSGSERGSGWTVARTSAGLYTVTFEKPLNRPLVWGGFMRDAAGRVVRIQAGDYNAANRTLQLRVSKPSGFIPLDIGSLRLIAGDVIGNTSEGMLLDGNTDPILQRVNAATDKALRVIWAANSVVEVQFPPVILPPDLLGNEDVTVHLLVGKDGNDDAAAVIDVQAFEGVGDTEMGGNTAALATASVTEYTRTLAAADIAGHPGVLTIGLIPGAHANDAIWLYGAWLEYVSEFVGYDASADADNEISFFGISEESLAALR